MNGSYKRRGNQKLIVQNSSAKIYGSVKHLYYYCNRSGHYKPKGHGKRSLQCQGTCRSGNTCIAHIKTMEDTLSKTLVVEYCSTHTGHEIQLSHLPILECETSNSKKTSGRCLCYLNT